MEFEGMRMVPILELGPSQLYLDQSKIEAVETWFHPEDMAAYEPWPVHHFGNGRYTLTDVHSRCYAAYKAGISRIPVVYDTEDIVSGEIGGRLYRADIAWCERFHVKSIRDLQNRILPHETYRRLWQERCERSYNLLTLTTEGERAVIRKRAPGLFLYGAAADLSRMYFENSDGDLFMLKNRVLCPEYP